MSPTRIVASLAVVVAIGIGLVALRWLTFDATGGAGTSCSGGRFIRHDTTVNDTRERKEWERFGSAAPVSYPDAERTCATAGRRLPTREELVELMQLGPSVDMPLDPCGFEGAVSVDVVGEDRFSRAYWTSSFPTHLPYLEKTPDADARTIVSRDLNGVGAFPEKPDTVHHVRCVRDLSAF